ncbi:hypothetical protein [Nonomuraea sp. KM88]|uniref:hypothetical protein n=1 Tax=Nonomuraea sp. KM88 TaxID=3457427 RepID=UPI003FCD5445
MAAVLPGLCDVRPLEEGDELEEQTIGNLSFEKVFRENRQVYFSFWPALSRLEP